MSRTVLVVDDEPDIRALLQEILEDEGYTVMVAETGAAAESAIGEAVPDLVLLDIWMPDVDGVSLLKSWKTSDRLDFPVIMISGHGTVETAVEATRLGAVDFIEKPVSLAKLLLTVDRAIAGWQREHAPADKRSPHGAARPGRMPLTVGDSAYVKSLRERLEARIGRRDSLLVVGEPGSGRLAFVQHLHDRDPDVPGDLVQLRCDALSSAQAERELFGERSDHAITRGYLESALDGTLCLSDVDQLPATAQSALRRALEQQSFVRVGDTERIPLRCRLIATARTDLSQTARSGRLDPVLARMLSNDIVTLEPLRDHPEDVPALLEAFVNWHVAEEGLAYRHFTVAAQNRLRNLDWPGNLLELKNLVQRLLLLGGASEIEVAEVDRALGIMPGSDTTIALRHDLPLREARADFERRYLLRCLKQTGGNIGELARHVGMERTHLYRKLRSLDIDLDKARE